MSNWTDQLANLIARGGIVMIPLIALSVISIALILERTWFWLRTNGGSRSRILQQIEHLVRTRDWPGLTALIRRDDSVYARIVRAIESHGTTDAEIMTAVDRERPRMERFMVALSTIITAAPLLGILGTVLGIIQSFRLLGDEAVLSDPAEVSTGIAEALLTTALGLTIALLTLFPYMIFRGQLDRTLGKLETLAALVQEKSKDTTTGK